MQLSFQIDFHIAEGQELCMVGNLPELGSWDEEKALVLIPHERTSCRGTIHIPDVNNQLINYCYFLRYNQATIRRESGKQREFLLPLGKESVFIRDFWREEQDGGQIFSTSLFSSLYKTDSAIAPKGNIQLRIFAPHLQDDEELCVVGDCESLGGWSLHKALPLSVETFPYRAVSFVLLQLPATFHYKYIIKNKETNKIIWEDGENRKFEPQCNSSVYILNDEVLRFGAKRWKAAGVSIPVFSLRTRQGFGVGEFLDLKKMADWAKAIGMKLIQILPINDTIAKGTKADSYPYNPISSFALHPMYLHLPGVAPASWNDAKEYAWEQNILNQLPTVDYEKVVERKLYYLRSIYQQQQEEIWEDTNFQSFVNEHRHWLEPYAVFCYLRDKYATTDFSKWGVYQSFGRHEISKLLEVKNPAFDTVAFYYFLQYHLHKQLTEAVAYARRLGVVLKGDIPIGVGRYSVDVWQYPQLFHTEVSAGAPPDDFSAKGQSWGFPTYNWDAMAQDNYNWWKERFGHMTNYFEAYRIDHILGFFRIWSIPLDAVWGVLGHFEKALPYTVEEIRKQGVPFDEKRYCKPYITIKSLEKVCGRDAQKIQQRYLCDLGNGAYTLREELNTQKKINIYFSVKQPEPTDTVFHEYLMTLAAEVLFVPDRKIPTKYHPRISLQKTTVYYSLPIAEQQSLDKLYDDFFYHRHNSFWQQKAEEKLQTLIPSTDMLACGEDLGMLPDSVPLVMRAFELLSLEIERMPKQLGRAYADLKELPYLSVCATGTHDMSPLRLWWQETTTTIQDYYQNVLNCEGKAPAEASADICRLILKNHLESSAILAIFPLQDWLAIDADMRNPLPKTERINIPSNSHHYWQYRMHLTLEELLESHSYNTSLINLLKESRR